jgi:hypothetical protein
MLKTIDIFIGLSLIMLLLSMVVTVITQAVTSLLNSRGKYLLVGVSDMLEQLHPGMTRRIAEQIANAALTHPLVSGTKGSLGSVIHREELTKLLLELGAGDGPQKLSDAAKQALESALVENGFCQNGTPDEIRNQIREKLQNIRAAALQLELAHPELSNAARARVAFLQQANSQFLAKINLWFDQTMDRASERFTAHARFVTFFGGLAVALALQLDTAALVSRLSSDNVLRQSLIDLAQKQTAPLVPTTPANAPLAPAGQGNAPTVDNQKAPPGTAQAQSNPLKLSNVDIQNVRDLLLNNVIGIPQSLSDWAGRWNRDNAVMKVLGILLTALLLSLGAPFWYGALQNLLRLRSALATKDDQQRQERQTSGQAPPSPGAPDGVVLTDERGDLAAVA